MSTTSPYPTTTEAENAVNITEVIPNLVDREAIIKYKLGSAAAVTMDIINDDGDEIDNVIAEQQRWQGDHEEKWERNKKVKSGSYWVRAVSIDKKGTAQDFEDFDCK